LLLFDFFNFDERRSVKIEELIQAENEEETEKEETFRCVNCGHDITTKKDRIAIHDEHEHTFVNPGGYVYHIGCFCKAPGCIQAGTSTAEHTWFRGYSWVYAFCGGCMAHLGWAYHSGDAGHFYGLILDRLAFY